MNITMNGESVEINTQTSLSQLLSIHNFANKIGIAVAINNSVIPKTAWDKHILQQNDNILIISATKGG